jgi:hypothetical protein
MLSFLPYDMLFTIIQYLLPQEFQQLYLSLQDEMLKQCVIECTVVVENELVKWFQFNNIKINLQERVITSIVSTSYYKNRLLHRDDDLPAFISKDKTTQCWFQYGKFHRENDKPAYINFINDIDYVEMRWYHNDIFQCRCICGPSHAIEYGFNISDFTL